MDRSERISPNVEAEGALVDYIFVFFLELGLMMCHVNLQLTERYGEKLNV